jgi:hypothetical protein
LAAASDIGCWKRRALQERDHADDAGHRNARGTHLEMARAYERRFLIIDGH